MLALQMRDVRVRQRADDSKQCGYEFEGGKKIKIDAQVHKVLNPRLLRLVDERNALRRLGFLRHCRIERPPKDRPDYSPAISSSSTSMTGGDDSQSVRPETPYAPLSACGIVSGLSRSPSTTSAPFARRAGNHELSIYPYGVEQDPYLWLRRSRGCVSQHARRRSRPRGGTARQNHRQRQSRRILR